MITATPRFPHVEGERRREQAHGEDAAVRAHSQRLAPEHTTPREDTKCLAGRIEVLREQLGIAGAVLHPDDVLVLCQLRHELG